MKDKYIDNSGKYKAIKTQFCYFPNRFWVDYDGKKTELYTGSDMGGGNYYELKGDYRKQVKQIVSLLGNDSSRALVVFFKKLI